MTGSPLWYLLEAGDLPDTPALAVFPSRIEQNLARMLEIAGGPRRLRPHVKTYKMAEIVRMQLRAGINRFKCATIAEAEMLAMEGVESVLLAYQPLGPKTERLIALIRKYPETGFSALTDHPEAAQLISSVFRKHGERLDVFIDINNGMNRTGIDPGHASDLFGLCGDLPGLNPAGLHIYDGHLRHRDPALREDACNRDFAPVQELIAAIRSKFLVGPEIVAGGSPTFTLHARRPDVVCSPGTSFLWDAGYRDAMPDLPFEPAAVLLTRVISLPAPDLVCIDLGHKSVAPENSLDNRIRILNAEGLVPLSHSEEHMVLRNTSGVKLKHGDLLFALPVHICPTVALYDWVTVIQEGRIADSWRVVARDRRIAV